MFAVFNNRSDAESAINEIKGDNLTSSNEDISIIMKNQEEQKELAQNTGTNIAEGTAKGATTGAVLGVIAGLLVGAGTIALPPLGGLIIAGPLATALGISTTAATALAGGGLGALGGGLIGALTGLGLSHEDATYYESAINNNNILVGIKNNEFNNESRIREILQSNNAQQIRTNY